MGASHTRSGACLREDGQYLGLSSQHHGQETGHDTCIMIGNENSYASQRATFLIRCSTLHPMHIITPYPHEIAPSTSACRCIDELVKGVLGGPGRQIWSRFLVLISTSSDRPFTIIATLQLPLVHSSFFRLYNHAFSPTLPIINMFSAIRTAPAARAFTRVSRSPSRNKCGRLPHSCVGRDLPLLPS